MMQVEHVLVANQLVISLPLMPHALEG
jgi:hypothetical protein